MLYTLLIITFAFSTKCTVKITKVGFDISDFLVCEEDYPIALESSSTVKKCCTLSNIFHELSDPECVFLHSYTTDSSLLRHAMNISLTAYEKDIATGTMAGAIVVIILIFLVPTIVCMAVLGYRVNHPGWNPLFSCFE